MRSDDGTGDALIGHTGFVGSNLLRRRDFDATYNSSSIGDIDGRRFDAVVCAGAAGVKWWANQNPGEDRVRIEGLMRHLDTIEASHFTLVSTVDVYDTPVGVDEDDEPSPDRLHPYGRNRLMLERHVVDRFADHLVVRLPGLFGPGLKKNAIHDLMHGERLGGIDPASRLQWYPLDRLADDLARARRLGLSRLNLATAPIAMATLCGRLFPDAVIGAGVSGTPAIYDMRTRHDDAFGGAGGVLMDADAVLAALARFVACA
ncbi:NAD-dependent epimerase/dehydratase family protein [Lichenicoccus roseus]|uniref:NAD(P)-dependent oxidoreductase n=1 Tax=Lichenicoccus roseus TaxID=2683649 RepID=A0A5R9JEZ2_9PROT|nr:NAD-dependent epimerase/dehydratase family protein [Lichenicoccus roseus]TLU73976.1 NAD(P)-dependent oxidoreductase [Lichenicoccus roseus]